MCYCVYIGADAALPLVGFDKTNSAFSLEPVAGWETTVAQHFSKQNIYYAGSWQGCSCGFAGGIDLEDVALVAKNLRSVRALLAYLDSALQLEDTIEFYTCWTGNQWQEPEQRRVESMYTVRAEPAYFELEEDVLITFTRKQPSL
ncbi:hypothetical protein [Hymenobacter cellulosilyticus]|uniref:Uncharacterized protein n=1 Tax=Hymenobacter cellulosilyticus TaxID=2932248 RepID=A0A8T9Q221_9BACT|nr:hypothetical protein [Hymenobacter cellulosilyticus]UOQ71095.1 hypothetical protein MUN79_20845 [Hymenobacter cellulosilyticus]